MRRCSVQVELNQSMFVSICNTMVTWWTGPRWDACRDPSKASTRWWPEYWRGLQRQKHRTCHSRWDGRNLHPWRIHQQPLSYNLDTTFRNCFLCVHVGFLSNSKQSHDSVSGSLAHSFWVLQISKCTQKADRGQGPDWYVLCLWLWLCTMYYVLCTTYYVLCTMYVLVCTILYFTIL